MIKITISKNKNNEYKGFQVVGHAGYAKSGEDIVCAAVSVLVINTLNSLDCFTKDSFETKTQDDKGLISCQFDCKVSNEGKLLLDSLVLGLQGIQSSYGSKYIYLKFKEV